MTSPDDARWMRRAFELARQARARGDAPFGAVLVSADGRVLAEGENTASSAGDPTGHAELNLLRGLLSRVPAADLPGARLYASGEPCPMCAAAIAWAGIGHVLYSVSAPRFGPLLRDRPGPSFSLRCADVLASTQLSIRLEADVLADEGERVFTGA